MKKIFILLGIAGITAIILGSKKTTASTTNMGAKKYIKPTAPVVSLTNYKDQYIWLTFDGFGSKYTPDFLLIANEDTQMISKDGLYKIQIKVYENNGIITFRANVVDSNGNVQNWDEETIKNGA